MKTSKTKSRPAGVAKAPTGIEGFDELTGGGLPRGRPTLVCGGPGSGKTMFALECLIRGALQYREPGVIVTFEETAEDLARNVASMGFDLEDLIARRKLAVDFVRVERAEIEETGAYDLEGLFVRIKHAVDRVGAKRVALDTVEALFAGLLDTGLLRAELRRLFAWFKEQRLTAVITGERGAGDGLTRQGLEEYVSDCVISLDQRISDQIPTRRLRVVKYRGTTHGSNEYPFLIDSDGITVFPITSLGLDFDASTRRVSSGVPELDKMLSGGYYRGSTVMATGSAGTGKTSLAAGFAAAECRAGRKALYFSFEESPRQLFRNMRSIGFDLEACSRTGRLKIHAARPTLLGLEQHIVRLRKLTEQFKPDAVVLDPVSSLLGIGRGAEVSVALTRMIDYLKGRSITAFMSVLTDESGLTEDSGVGISSLIDTWLLLRDVESDGERNRALFIIKSRGMAHSNQVREFKITGGGLKLIEPYRSAGGLLLGRAREAHRDRDRVGTRS